MYSWIYQCPTQFGFSGVFALTEEISLVSAGPFCVTNLDSRGEFANSLNCASFFFTHKLAENRPKPIQFERLKEFILFWSFLFEDGVSHDFFERSLSNCRVDQDMPSAVALPDVRVNLANFQVHAGLQTTSNCFDLRDLYTDYLASPHELRQWVSLLMFNPYRGMVNHAFSLHDNYRMSTSFAWTILEALSGYNAQRCESSIECPKGCRDPDDPAKPAFARTGHPLYSVRERVRKLFEPFPECDYLVQVAMTIYRNDRNFFYHKGEGQRLPAVVHSNVPAGGREYQVATRSDVKLYGKDPLETYDAIILLRDAIRCLLLNRIFPQLGFFPTFERLKSVSIRF